jgi:hypothetical protein
LKYEIANFCRARGGEKFRRRTTSDESEEKISEVKIVDETRDGWKRVEAAELEKYSG